MSKINPRVDFAFKILFGSEENKDILLSFVNSVLLLENQLIELELLNPYNHKTHSTGKLSVLDIKAKDKTGKIYHIEMQMNDQVSYDQRALYYWSKLYSQQLKEGDEFFNLRKTISIHVLNFNHLDESDYHNIYHLLNIKTHRRYLEDIELHFIELKKFNKDFAHLTTPLDRWISFLTKAEQWEKNFVPPELRGHPAIEKAAHALDFLSLDQEEQKIYEAQLKWLRTQSAVLAKVREEFIEKGELIGLKKGETIGIDKGKREVAINLIKNDRLTMVEISKTTGLPEEVICALIEETLHTSE